MSKRWVRIAFFAICIAIFAFLFYCNCKTPYLADDYAYMYDFSYEAESTIHPPVDAPRIESIGQIFRSMAAHRSSMNGRVIAHFLVQLFLMGPKMIFNVFNSLMFVLELALIFLCGKTVVKKNINELFQLLLFCAIFAAIWVFQPKFGQVNLWLDGSINYLWSAVFSLAYILVLLKDFCAPQKKQSLIKTILFCLFSFMCGAYCENSSIALLFISFCLNGYIWIKNKRPEDKGLASFVCTFAGFVFMVTAPAELINKVSFLSVYKVTCNFIDLMDYMKEFWLIWAAALILLVLAFLEREDKKTIFLACVFFLSAIVSCICLIVALYVTERSLFITLVLLLVEIAILSLDLFEKKKAFLTTSFAVLLMVTPYYLAIGFRDFGVTNTMFQKNEEIIAEAKANGEMDVPIYYVVTDTKYCALTGIGYLSEDPDSYPNCYMAKYYGVNSITIK